jgi:transcriptional regulator with XRE-family HTH domain
MDQEKIGTFIKKIRLDNNLTQNDFAKKYGVTYQAVSKWERGINMPDISLLKQISKDFNIDMSDLLEGEYNKNNNNKKKWIYILGSIIVIVVMILSIYLYSNNKQQFSFKTLSTSCKDFKITGSIAYNNSKSSIYISSIDYCGKDTNIEYSHIECILYEVEDDNEKEINKYVYEDDKKITLEKFFKDVKFKVDNYDRICKKYNNHSLYLKVNAYNDEEKITSYKVSIKVSNDCF